MYSENICKLLLGRFKPLNLTSKLHLGRMYAEGSIPFHLQCLPLFLSSIGQHIQPNELIKLEFAFVIKAVEFQFLVISVYEITWVFVITTIFCILCLYSYCIQSQILENCDLNCITLTFIQILYIQAKRTHNFLRSRYLLLRRRYCLEMLQFVV